MVLHQEQVHIAQAEAPALERVTWYKEPGLRKLYFFGFILCMACATTGYDGSMLNGLQILPIWQSYFHHPQGSILGLFGSIYSIGNLVGLPFAPLLSDNYGRRVSIATGCFMLTAGAIVQCTSINFPMFIVARLFVGIGCGLAQASAPLLLTELCHPQHRGVVTACYNVFFNVGSLIATWLTYGTFKMQSDWSWRIPSLFQAVPSLLLVAFLWWIPESPRWLINNDRESEALAILAKYHANGDEMNPTVQFEFLEIRDTLRLETHAKRSSSYLDFFRTRGNRYRFMLLIALGLFSQWSGNGLTSYYFSIVMDGIGITDPNTQFKINGCNVIVSLVVGLAAASMIDRVGRRPLFLVGTAGMLVSFSVWTACSGIYDVDGDLTAGKVVVAFIFIYGVFYHISWSGPLVAYTVEIMPYKLRAKGLMSMNYFVQAALVFNQYVNPIGLGAMKPRWHFYTIYCVWILFVLIFVYFVFPETKGPTLEEIARIFDGDEAEVATVDPANIDLLDDKKGGVRVELVEDVGRKADV